MNGSPDDISHLFRFTNLRTLTIHGFRDSLSLEFDKLLIGTSPVECLRLIACGAHEEPLTSVLSLPAALKTLHYDVEQYGWEINYGFPPKYKYWTCAAFMRTLQWQKATLVELAMTRPWDKYKFIDDGPRLDLSEFTSLQTLRIYHAFLCGDGHCPYRVWKGLPHKSGGVRGLLRRYRRHSILMGGS
ncbi:unnamed protein product [Penicillium nalgiovense]|nr:unnamed protein product [Penicillium nalgiovense]